MIGIITKKSPKESKTRVLLPLIEKNKTKKEFLTPILIFPTQDKGNREINNS